MLLSEHLRGRGVERQQVLVISSGGNRQEVADPHQVVGGGSEGEHPTDPVNTSMPGLAQAADGLHPTEDLFHPFALDLTDGVTRMAGGAAVDGAVSFARDVRSDLISAQLTHQVLLVVTLIAAQRNSMPAGDLCRHREGRLGFCAAALA